MSRFWKLVLLSATGASIVTAILPFRVHANAGPPPGLALAQTYCAECHMVVPSASRGWTDAPSFESVANRPGTTIAGLTAIIEKPHMDMLNTRRPPNEAHAIAAYIMTLRQRP